MASVCVPQGTDNSLFALLPEYVVQPSRLPVQEGTSFSENGEILDSDSNSEDDNLPSVSEILARLRRIQRQTRSPGPLLTNLENRRRFRKHPL